MNFNTLYQLYYLAKNRPAVLNEAETMLLMPDLFAYFLTGKKRLEYTNASTTNLLDAKTKKINTELLDKLGIRSDIFPEMIFPGEAYGNLLPEICEELHCDSVPVIAVPTHDTASAVCAVPTLEKDYAYISCGTWSLLGTVIDEPILTEESLGVGFTNEGGDGSEFTGVAGFVEFAGRAEAGEKTVSAEAVARVIRIFPIRWSVGRRRLSVEELFRERGQGIVPYFRCARTKSAGQKRRGKGEKRVK